MKGDPVRDAKGNLIAVNMMGRLMPVEKITAGHVASYLWVLLFPLVMGHADLYKLCRKPWGCCESFTI